MSHYRVKIIVVVAALAAAVGLLAIAGVSGGWVYYMSVDQFVAAENHQQQRVRLHGIVGEEDFVSNNAGLFARFDLLGEESILRVEYEGIIPDNFRPGHEVITEGRLDSEGVFQADSLMTKCGSRYESDGDGPSKPEHHPPLTQLGANE